MTTQITDYHMLYTYLYNQLVACMEQVKPVQQIGDDQRKNIRLMGKTGEIREQLQAAMESVDELYIRRGELAPVINPLYMPLINDHGGNTRAKRIGA